MTSIGQKRTLNQDIYSMKLNRGEPDHPHWKKPFTNKELAVAWWAIGTCLALLGLLEWFDPSQAPFSGRWSWVKTVTIDAMGPRVIAILHMSFGAIWVAAGFLKWSAFRGQKQVRIRSNMVPSGRVSALGQEATAGSGRARVRDAS